MKHKRFSIMTIILLLTSLLLTLGACTKDIGGNGDDVQSETIEVEKEEVQSEEILVAETDEDEEKLSNETSSDNYESEIEDSGASEDAGQPETEKKEQYQPVNSSNNEENQTGKTETVSSDLTKYESSVEAYNAVLKGDADFLVSHTGEILNIGQIREAITTDTSITIEAKFFSVIDLDSDGTLEVILNLYINDDNYYGVMVLHYQDGIIYGYVFSQREFSEPKTDGTFYYSSGAGDNGIGKIAFDKDEESIERIAFEETVYDPETESGLKMAYFINYEEATSEEFDAVIDEQLAKPEVKYYEFTVENIDMILK